MAESNDRKDAIAYYKKIGKLREMSLTCDFAKDKMIMGLGKPIPYLSAGKIRQQFAPLFTKVGLEFEPSFTDLRELSPAGSKGMQHMAITFNVRFIDIDTGYAGPVLSYLGEGADPLDKAARKAMTFAYKSWLSDFFCIEEGLDPEAQDVGGGAFVPKTPEEQVEVKTKLAAQAIKPEAPAAKPAKPAVAPAPTIKPAETPIKPPAKETPKVAPAPAGDIPEPGCDNPNFSPSGPLVKTLKERYQNWAETKEKGLIAQSIFDKFVADYRNIADMPSALAFNTKYPAQK